MGEMKDLGSLARALLNVIYHQMEGETSKRGEGGWVKWDVKEK